MRFTTIKTPENLALRRAVKQSELIEDPALRDEIQDALAVIARAHLLRFQKNQHDERERVLIGSMVRIEDADRYRECAKNSDRSICAFARDAFETEVQRFVAKTLATKGKHEAGE